MYQYVSSLETKSMTLMFHSIFLYPLATVNIFLPFNRIWCKKKKKDPKDEINTYFFVYTKRDLHVVFFFYRKRFLKTVFPFSSTWRLDYFSSSESNIFFSTFTWPQTQRAISWKHIFLCVCMKVVLLWYSCTVHLLSFPAASSFKQGIQNGIFSLAHC